jgi:hypothetical protein
MKQIEDCMRRSATGVAGTFGAAAVADAFQYAEAFVDEVKLRVNSPRQIRKKVLRPSMRARKIEAQPARAVRPCV